MFWQRKLQLVQNNRSSLKTCLRKQTHWFLLMSLKFFDKAPSWTFRLVSQPKKKKKRKNSKKVFLSHFLSKVFHPFYVQTNTPLVLLIMMIHLFGLIEQGWPQKILQFLFQKLLKHSHVGNFGIITSEIVLSILLNCFVNTKFFSFISYKMLMNILSMDFIKANGLK